MIRWLGILTLATFVATAAEESPSSASQDRPVFRSGVQSIEVDVRVTDRDGQGVRDLTKNDFVLEDDGVLQTITAFSLVDLAIESPMSPRVSGAIESDTVTNAGSGRMWVILLGWPYERAHLVARRFIEEALGSNDEVAVISVLGTMSSAQGFTRSRRRMLEAVDRLRADSLRATGIPARTPFQVLEEVCQRLGTMGGRRKTVLFFDPPALWAPGATPGLQALWFDQRDAIRAATRNNVAVYVVSSFGLTEFGRFPLTTIGALRALAEDTGGDVIVNSNNFSDGYQRFVRDSSAYYLLGYVPSVEHRDGEFHRLTVRVRRPGVSVRARPGYYAPKPDATPAMELTAPPADLVANAGLSRAAREALRLPLSVNGLAIDLFATPFRGSGRDANVLVGAHVHGSGLVLGQGEPIEVGYQAMTTEGRVTPGGFKTLTLNLSPSSKTVAESTGLRYVDHLTLSAGRHQVRFVVHQPNGKTGMVVADVEVPDFSKAAVSLSGVVLASERLTAQPALYIDETLRRVVGGDPTALRRFSRQDVLTAFAEVYTNARTRPEDVRIRTTVAPRLAAPPPGKPRAGDVGDARGIVSRVVAAESGRMGVVTRLDLSDLAAGDYVLTLEARAGRQTATRQVVFAVVADATRVKSDVQGQAFA